MKNTLRCLEVARKKLIKGKKYIFKGSTLKSKWRVSEKKKS